MKRLLLIVTCMLASAFVMMAGAQVQIQFQPVIHGKTLEGLTFFQVNNQAAGEFRASLKIVLTEERSGKVLEVNVPQLQIRKGISGFNRSLLAAGETKFSASPFASIIRQTGKIPEGEYEVCYELSLSDEKSGLQDFYENCFHFSAQPLTPLQLADPIDEEKICNRRPAFTWQPPMPFDANARYRIIVVELKEKQAPVEAISYNQPLINSGELREPRMSYPPNIKELEKGKTYAWQVLYSVNNALLSRSEIWTFRVDCEEEKQAAVDDSYRELKSWVNGDFYIARGKLKFAVVNPYSDGELNFTISSLDDPSKVIQHLPKLKLESGLNKYELDLGEYKSFRNGEHYQLVVQLPNSEKLYLRFTYQE